MCRRVCFYLGLVRGFGRTLPIVGDLLPRTPGLDAFGGITLFGIYLAARWVRMSGMVDKIRAWHLAIAVPLLWVATGVGLGDYNSPFAFALACGMFVVVKKGFSRGERENREMSVGCNSRGERENREILGGLRRLVGWLGPSMFSVYLMHTNEVGFPLLAKLDAEIGVVGAAVVVFIGCVVLDLPRRAVGLFAIEIGRIGRAI